LSAVIGFMEIMRCAARVMSQFGCRQFQDDLDLEGLRPRPVRIVSGNRPIRRGADVLSGTGLADNAKICRGCRASECFRRHRLRSAVAGRASRQLFDRQDRSAAVFDHGVRNDINSFIIPVYLREAMPSLRCRLDITSHRWQHRPAPRKPYERSSDQITPMNPGDQIVGLPRPTPAAFGSDSMPSKAKLARRVEGSLDVGPRVEHARSVCMCRWPDMSALTRPEP